jgi:hypothetical protein
MDQEPNATGQSVEVAPQELDAKVIETAKAFFKTLGDLPGTKEVQLSEWNNITVGQGQVTKDNLLYAYGYKEGDDGFVQVIKVYPDHTEGTQSEALLILLNPSINSSRKTTISHTIFNGPPLINESTTVISPSDLEALNNAGKILTELRT